jgi:hypothetical protein
MNRAFSNLLVLVLILIVGWVVMAVPIALAAAVGVRTYQWAMAFLGG